MLDSNSDWGSDPDSDSDSDSDWASASEDGDDDDAEDSIEVPAGLVIVGLSVVESADDAGVLAGAVASTEPSFAEAEVVSVLLHIAGTGSAHVDDKMRKAASTGTSAFSLPNGLILARLSPVIVGPIDLEANPEIGRAHV